MTPEQVARQALESYNTRSFYSEWWQLPSYSRMQLIRIAGLAMKSKRKILWYPHIIDLYNQIRLPSVRWLNLDGQYTDLIQHVARIALRAGKDRGR